MKLKNLLLLVMALTLVVSCDDNGIFASGSIISETRSVDNFHSLDISVPANIYISQEPDQNLRIETHENIMSVVETVVINGELNISLSRSLRRLETLDIYISAADYERIELSGAASLRSEGCLNLDNLDIRSSGASNFNLCGQADEVSLRLSGASNFKGYGMEAQTVRAVVSGASNIRVTAEQLLDVTISGASQIRYKGNPQINSDISGAGSLVNAN
ncbi:MAG: DUF2807 domain-containing protein [Roseivirga sp.]|nr:DUF2807 domain-containing protein [Roseivirga sp.]